jgi:RNA polymerase sigma factor (sigma-70 family)
MNDMTRILTQLGQGDPAAAEQLLPLVYNELRRLAAAKLAHERPGQTLQATALVHEAYLRLVGGREGQNAGIEGRESADQCQKSEKWNSLGHFFAAAAQAMRRILVENARRRGRLKRGGDLQREELELAEIAAPDISPMAPDLIRLDEALNRLALEDPESVELVKLRYFAGLTIPQAAEAMGISSRKANFLWSFARAWLRREIEGRS